MKRCAAYCFLFLFVFAAGFYCGQQTATKAERSSVPTTVSIPSADDVSVLSADEQIGKALEDPDFKRLHDFLQRETPMQMKLEPKR